MFQCGKDDFQKVEIDFLTVGRELQKIMRLWNLSQNWPSIKARKKTTKTKRRKNKKQKDGTGQKFAIY